MTQKQKLFIEKLIENGGNATEAAASVFDCKTRHMAEKLGSEYVRKREIAKELAKRQGEVIAKAAYDAEVSVEFVLDGLKRVAEVSSKRYKTKDAVKSEEEYEQVVNAAGANKALELLGKHLGMFPDAVTLRGDKANPLQVGLIEVALPPDEDDHKDKAL